MKSFQGRYWNSWMSFLGLLFFCTSSFASKTIKVLTFNAGSAAVQVRGFEIVPYPERFKLAGEYREKLLRELLEVERPDVVMLQEVQGEEQLSKPELLGSPFSGEDKVYYDFRCPKTNQNPGIETEVCIAWNRSRFSLQRDCDVVVGRMGGAMMCSLQDHEKDLIQAISLHTTIHDLLDREEVLREVWSSLIRTGQKVVIGGDFNTRDCTMPGDCLDPYPKGFWTLFGRHKNGFGIREQKEHDFYGTYEGGKPKTKTSTQVLNLFKSWKQLDHLFSNFGKPKSFVPKTANLRKCSKKEQGYAYVADGGDCFQYEMPKLSVNANALGWVQDHRPILGMIEY